MNFKFVSEVIFNIGGVVLYYKVILMFDLVVGYLYMCVIKVNGIVDVVIYY